MLCSVYQALVDSFYSPESHKRRWMNEATVKQKCTFKRDCVLVCDYRSGHVEKQEKQSKNETMKPKMRRHRTSSSDEPDMQESAFLKKIIAYQRKLLVLPVFQLFTARWAICLLPGFPELDTQTCLSLVLWFLLQNYFARNFYNMRMLALFVAFAINFILLFYKVTVPRVLLWLHCNHLFFTICGKRTRRCGELCCVRVDLHAELAS